MAPVRKTVIAISVIAGTALVSAFAGGTVGFLQGYAFAIGDTSVRASTLVTALRTLRAGDVAKGVFQLESDLDTLIVEHWASNRSEPPLFSWLARSIRDDAADRKLFARVARYRAEYASASDMPEVSTIITSHLKGFQAQ
jgi:hypothetical protein